MKRLSAALFVVLLALACACDDASKPVEPVWNKQPCDSCHMLLSEPRYAAQLATQDGRRFFFDDIGCLVTYLAEHPAPNAQLWVHDETTWRDAAQTHYASGAHTPMGYGFATAASGPLDWSAVKSAVRDHAKSAATGTTP